MGGGSGSSIPHKVFVLDRCSATRFTCIIELEHWSFLLMGKLKFHKAFFFEGFPWFPLLNKDIHFAPPSLSCSSKYISVKTNIYLNSETLAIRYLLDLHSFQIACKGFAWNLKHLKQKEPCSFQLIQKTNTQVWYDFLPPQKKSLDFLGESPPPPQFFGPTLREFWWRYPEMFRCYVPWFHEFKGVVSFIGCSD